MSGAGSGLFVLVVKYFLRWILFAPVLAAFVYGAFRVTVLVLIAAGPRVDGRVVSIDVHERVIHDADGRSSHTESESSPVVRYRSPLDGELRRFASRTPFSYERGLAVRVWVSRILPGQAEIASAGVFLLPLVFLLLGYLFTVAMLFAWNLVSDGPPPTLFYVLFPPAWTVRGVARAVLLLAIVSGSVCAIGWTLGRFTSWARPVWTSLREGRDELGTFQALGEARGAPLLEGLTPAQRAVLRAPILGEWFTQRALGQSIRGLHGDELRALLRAFADPALGLGDPPVDLYSRAVAAGDVQAIRLLAAAEVDASEDGDAIRSALDAGRIDLLRAMLEVGAAPTSGDLGHAIELGSEEAVAVLLGRADLDLAGLDWSENTVLDEALLQGMGSVARALRDRRALTALPAWIWAVVDGDAAALARELPEERWPTEKLKRTSLIVVAARAGQLALVNRVIELGGHPDWPDDEEAVRGAAEHGHTAVVLRLAPPRTSIWGMALLAAIEARRWECAKALVAAAETGGKVADSAYEMGKALHAAARAGNASLVEFLLSRGADPDWAEDDGVVALERAEAAEVVQVLAPVTHL